MPFSMHIGYYADVNCALVSFIVSIEMTDTTMRKDMNDNDRRSTSWVDNCFLKYLLCQNHQYLRSLNQLKRQATSERYYFCGEH